MIRTSDLWCLLMLCRITTNGSLISEEFGRWVSSEWRIRNAGW